MKKLLALSIFLVLGFVGFSQSTAESFLSVIPTFPANACTMKKSDQADFLRQLDQLIKPIKDEIERQTTAANNAIKVDQNKIMTGYAKQMGLSNSDMVKMKNGKQLSKEEKMAISEKMMNEKFNMSVEEARNLQKMSKQGKQAWGEAYGAEMMANAANNPQQVQQQAADNKRMVDLIVEQKKLNDQLAGSYERSKNKAGEFFLEVEKAKADLAEKEKPILKELAKYDGGEGSTGNEAQLEQLSRQLYELELTFCNQFTPRYFALLSDELTEIKKMIPVMNKAEEVNYEMLRMQSKTQIRNSSSGLQALQAVEGYFEEFKNCFQFVPTHEPPTE
jgi:hypothetical protein